MDGFIKNERQLSKKASSLLVDHGVGPVVGILAFHSLDLSLIPAG